MLENGPNTNGYFPDASSPPPKAGKKSLKPEVTELIFGGDSAGKKKVPDAPALPPRRLPKWDNIAQDQKKTTPPIVAPKKEKVVSKLIKFPAEKKPVEQPKTKPLPASKPAQSNAVSPHKTKRSSFLDIMKGLWFPKKKDAILASVSTPTIKLAVAKVEPIARRKKQKKIKKVKRSHKKHPHRHSVHAPVAVRKSSGVSHKKHTHSAKTARRKASTSVRSRHLKRLSSHKNKGILPMVSKPIATLSTAKNSPKKQGFSLKRFFSSFLPFVAPKPTKREQAKNLEVEIKQGRKLMRKLEKNLEKSENLLPLTSFNASFSEEKPTTVPVPQPVVAKPEAATLPIVPPKAVTPIVPVLPVVPEKVVITQPKAPVVAPKTEPVKPSVIVKPPIKAASSNKILDKNALKIPDLKSLNVPAIPEFAALNGLLASAAILKVAKPQVKVAGPFAFFGRLISMIGHVIGLRKNERVKPASAVPQIIAEKKPETPVVTASRVASTPVPPVLKTIAPVSKVAAPLIPKSKIIAPAPKVSTPAVPAPKVAAPALAPVVPAAVVKEISTKPLTFSEGKILPKDTQQVDKAESEHSGVNVLSALLEKFMGGEKKEKTPVTVEEKKLAEEKRLLEERKKKEEEMRRMEMKKKDAEKAAPPGKLTERQKYKNSAWAEFLGAVKYFGMGKERLNIIQNLATMLNAGLPLIDSLKTLKMEMRVKPAKNLIQTIVDAVENGSPLWRAMEAQHFFSAHAIALIRIGEEAGSLAENMQYLAAQMEKDAELKAKVKMAMIYPIIVLTLMFFIVMGLGMFVLPNLIQVLFSLNVKLPFITRMVIAFTNGFTTHGATVIPSVFGGVIFLILLTKFTRFKVLVQWIMFHIPGIGQLAREATLARFGVILGGLLQAGVPLVEALRSLAEVTPTVAYRNFYFKMLEHINVGDSFAKTFALIKGSEKILPISVQQLVITGERTGTLAKIMLKVADIYDKKANDTAQKLPVILEPMLLLFIGGLVGTIAFAIIIPIYSIVGNVSH